ncbi:MAG: NTP transferase domain-containing protein [Candidatus Bruticola sp.]
MYDNRFAIILLGAGSSSRMSVPKQLLPWKGSANLIEHACLTCLQSKAVCSVFVLGANAEKILAVLPWLKQNFADSHLEATCLKEDNSAPTAAPRFSTVINHNWSLGMSSSLKVGLSELLNNFSQAQLLDSAAVFLADLPLVTSAIIDSIADLGGRLAPHELQSCIIVPVWQGRRGHPVFFGRRFWPELLLISGDKGAGSLLKKYSEHCLYWQAEGPEIYWDCDTPDAYIECCRKTNF